MRDMFSMDSPLMRFLTKIADLMILNLIFILFCVPIVTIGASFTALYYVTLKLCRDEEGEVVKQFTKAFKENFKNATIVYIILLVIAVVLGYDVYLSYINGYPETVRIAMFVLLAIIACLSINIFPLISKFDMTVKDSFKNAIVVMLTHLVKTIFMVIFTVVPVVITYRKIELFPVFAMLGFSVMAFVNSVWLAKIYDEMIDNYKLGSDETIEPTLDEEE